MQQQDYLAQHGAIHHYKIDQVLRWLLDRFEDGRIQPEPGHHQALLDCRSSLAKLPSNDDSLSAAKTTAQLIHSYSQKLRPREYSDMYAVLDSALADLQYAGGLRALIRSNKEKK